MPARRAIVIQHLEAEGPYAIADALTRAGVAIDVVRTDHGTGIPHLLVDVAAVVVMGGPMSATSDVDYPTRTDEIRLLQSALAVGVPVLGVCLGAQLLAVAAGGSVIPGDGLEVGWAPVEMLPDAAADPLLGGTPERLTVLHWHGETYTLPERAVALARSERYEQQAFRVGATAWGLQFHLEVDHNAVAAFAAAFPDDAEEAISGRSSLHDSTAVERLAAHRDRILDRFAAIAAAHDR